MGVLIVVLIMLPFLTQAVILSYWLGLLNCPTCTKKREVNDAERD